MRVLVTGAGGRTGAIIVRKLLELPGSRFRVRAMVRSAASASRLRSELGELVVEIVQGDVTRVESLEGVFRDMDALVIATSAVPRVSRSSLVSSVLLRALRLGGGPSFWFEEGGRPCQVDWIGQRNQVDAARASGLRRVVLLSAMGGTKPEHFLNTHMEDLCLWKRRGERYLIASGLTYTIVHAGGLESAPGGLRKLHLSLDDALLETRLSLVPREDVAEVCVRCLLTTATEHRSFDLGSGPEHEGQTFQGDLDALLRGLGDRNCSYKGDPELPRQGALCCSG